MWGVDGYEAWMGVGRGWVWGVYGCGTWIGVEGVDECGVWMGVGWERV